MNVVLGGSDPALNLDAGPSGPVVIYAVFARLRRSRKVDCSIRVGFPMPVHVRHIPATLAGLQ